MTFQQFQSLGLRSLSFNISWHTVFITEDYGHGMELGSDNHHIYIWGYRITHRRATTIFSLFYIRIGYCGVFLSQARDRGYYWWTNLDVTKLHLLEEMKISILLIPKLTSRAPDAIRAFLHGHRCMFIIRLRQRYRGTWREYPKMHQDRKTHTHKLPSHKPLKKIICRCRLLVANWYLVHENIFSLDL